MVETCALGLMGSGLCTRRLMAVLGLPFAAPGEQKFHSLRHVAAYHGRDRDS